MRRLIHSNDFCRDIAIWYDEFLVPGENFNDAIYKAMEKSELFAMVVTPSILEIRGCKDFDAVENAVSGYFGICQPSRMG